MQLCLYDKYIIHVGLGHVYHTFIFLSHIIYKVFSQLCFYFYQHICFVSFDWYPGPLRILHFNLSFLRSGAKLRSLGSGGSADLNVMVSELKDMRESAKGFMNAQNSGNEELFT